MTISLKPDVQKFVEAKIRSGQFTSPQDAVNGILSQAMELEQLTPDDIEAMRLALDSAIAEADNGQFVQFTAEDIIAERLAARKKVS